jgi:chromate transporter
MTAGIDDHTAAARSPSLRPGTPAEVFLAFLRLGLTSFGGPVAHLGYFHRELVQRRGWLREESYAQLLALCQFLPGPASSQLGFALGMLRAGWPGALAAFVGFTTPSALLMGGFAALLPRLEGRYPQAAVHGLKLLAVAVVAQGLLAMARRLTPDAPRALVAAAVAALVAVSGSGAVQLVAIVLGGVLGWLVCRSEEGMAGRSFAVGYGPRAGVGLLALFGVLLVGALAMPPLGHERSLVAAAGAFYCAGALVFGGGHVVLPLLQQAVVRPGGISSGDFLAGYGAAQALPGPLFAFAAFLGARLGVGAGAYGAFGALLAVLAIFLPGLLLVAGALPLWQTVASHRGFVRAVAGVNAAVVGLLAAALYSPVWTSAVLAPADFATALVAFTLLVAARSSVLWTLVWCVGVSLLRTLL